MMPIPLKVVDRGGLLTEGLSLHIQERTDKLGHFFERVKRCLVTVDGPGQHPLAGRVRVRLQIIVPNSQIVIDRRAGADVGTAIRVSFDAADQRIEDYVRLKRDSVGSAKRRVKQL